MTEQSPNDDYMGLVAKEVLHAKQYIQLIEVCLYKRRDGEILYEPFYPPKNGNEGTVVRAMFFITTKDKTKMVNVLYRVFGNMKRKTDITKVTKEIERRAHMMYYSTRSNDDVAFAIRNISLEESNWNR